MNRENFSKAASLCFALVFAGILAVMGIISIFDFGNTRSFFENRKLAEFPESSVEGIRDGNYFSGIEDFLKDHSALRDELIEAKTYTDLFILRRPVVNDIVAADDVLLPFLEYEEVDADAIAEDAAEAVLTVKTHAETVESYGGKFYYIAMPNQYLCYGEYYPWYLNDRSEYLEIASSAFMSGLGESGVSCIDMYEHYLDSGSPDYMTSKIDHHYSIGGAWHTLMSLLYRIDTDTDFSYDMEEYDFAAIEELPNRYVGSRSRKLFGLVEGSEKIGIIGAPKDLSFDRWNNGNKVSSKVYKLPSNDTDDVTYTTYMGGDIANTVIKTYREDLPSILIYGESFTNALESIAWQYFDEMHSIDLRHYKEMTLDAYIEQTKPDIVVCVREYSSMILPENGAE